MRFDRRDISRREGDDLLRRHAWREIRFLLQINSAHSTLIGDAAPVRLDFASGDLHQRAFAGAVFTDQGDTVAEPHFEK